MATSYDLYYDPNEVGPDCVVECWIPHGPRADDTSFDPQPGDIVSMIDDDAEPLSGRVFRREGDRVWVQAALATQVVRTG